MNSRPVIKRFTIVILVLAMAGIAGWALLQGKRDPGAETAAPAAAHRVAILNGVTVVALDAATQAQSGIRTELLAAANYQPETVTYGSVLDLQPLLDLRARYFSAQADAGTARAMVAASRQEYERSRLLYQDNKNVSLKTYQAARAAYLSDQARADAAALAAQSIQAAVRQQFGATLGRWALDPRSSEGARLLDRKEVVVRVTVPPGAGSAVPARIQITANDNRRLPAYLVSPSPQSDPAIQGSAFIYRVTAPIAAGTTIVAYLPTAGHTTRGTCIPAGAVVWYGGQPWAYLQMGSDHFGRYPLAQKASMPGGFFVAQGFKAGERVVVGGAQLLLSEELRPQGGGSAGSQDPDGD
ncbi:MAG: metal transporter [Proteobacteria bacterium]|nr:metal transporter [Pseudomonadota bacterium]